MSDVIPTPTDLAHDLNRVKVELREEQQNNKTELRDEFRAAIATSYELADARSVARHDNLATRIDGLAAVRDSTTAALTEAVHVFRDDVTRRFNEADLRYQQRFDAQQKAVQDALQAAEKAVSAALANADRAVLKAESAAEKRFESVNEFRNTLSDQATLLLTRAEAEARFNAISDKMGTLNDLVVAMAAGTKGIRESVEDRRASSSLTSGQLATGAAFLVVILMVVALFISERPSAPQLIPGQVGSQTTTIPPRVP